MTAFAKVWLTCDSSTECDEQFTIDATGLAKTRRVAAERGAWRSFETRDYCPEHAEEADRG